MAADIGALGNYRNRNRQLWGMIVLVPLSQTSQQCYDKYHEKQAEHDKEHKLKKSETKTESHHFPHPLFFRYAILYHFF